MNVYEALVATVAILVAGAFFVSLVLADAGYFDR